MFMFLVGFALCLLLLVLANKRLRRFANTIVFIDGRMATQRQIITMLKKSRASKNHIKKLQAVAFGRLSELEKVRSFLSRG